MSAGRGRFGAQTRGMSAEPMAGAGDRAQARARNPGLAKPGRSPDADAAPEGEWVRVRLEVEPSAHGLRLDVFLARKIGRLSRAHVRRILARGQVRPPPRVPLRPGVRVRAGQVWTLWRPAPREPSVVRSYAVLHEDADLLAVDKPSGLPVHPSARYHHGTLTALMRERLGADHPWIMSHRLDRETSGVLLFARRGAAAAAVARAFQERRVRKEYLAIVRGELAPGVRRIELPLGPARGSIVRIKMGPRPEGAGGRAARTDVEPLAWGTHRGEPVTLVRARPRTGRQHQIRAHLAAVGAPILGDKLYGACDRDFVAMTEGRLTLDELGARVGLARQALHAAWVRVPHPRGGTLTVAAPWPAELGAVIPWRVEPEPGSKPSSGPR